MASTTVRSLVPLVCLKCNKRSVPLHFSSRLSWEPGGDTGCLVSSYESLVKTVESPLHSLSTLLQFSKHFDVSLLLLTGFVALVNIIRLVFDAFRYKPQ